MHGRDGWIDAPPRPGTFVCNLGDMLERIPPVPLAGETPAEARARWDGEDVFALTGTYGEHLLDKVGKVFPDLRARVIDP